MYVKTESNKATFGYNVIDLFGLGSLDKFEWQAYECNLVKVGLFFRISCTWDSLGSGLIMLLPMQV